MNTLPAASSSTNEQIKARVSDMIDPALVRADPHVRFQGEATKGDAAEGIGGGDNGHYDGCDAGRQDLISIKPVKCSVWQTDKGVFQRWENGVHAEKKYGFT
jgi:hypothetical protein